MAPPSEDPVLGWLLEGDPAIRWQTMRDLLSKPAAAVAREQARIEREGWGARLLAEQAPDGRWAGLYTPKWTSSTYTLLLLRGMGLRAGNRNARTAATILLDEGLYSDNGINFWLPRRLRSETCVTGMVLAIGSRFAPGDNRLDRPVQYLLSEQMADGGWNCRRGNGATHSSLHTTISVLEGLLEYEQRGGAGAKAARMARARGHEFLYLHRMFRSHRTGEIIDGRMTRFAFPPQWHYDVLRGLDYLRAADAPRDERLAEAIELVMKSRGTDGRWPLQHVYAGRYYFPMETKGRPSRWNTLRALRVLRWWNEA